METRTLTSAGALSGQVDAPGDQVELDPATAELEQLVAQLTIANETNRVIGAAIGLLMERYGISYALAHQHLIGLSQDSNTKMRLVAAALVGPMGLE